SRASSKPAAPCGDGFAGTTRGALIRRLAISVREISALVNCNVWLDRGGALQGADADLPGQRAAGEGEDAGGVSGSGQRTCIRNRGPDGHVSGQVPTSTAKADALASARSCV